MESPIFENPIGGTFKYRAYLVFNQAIRQDGRE